MSDEEKPKRQPIDAETKKLFLMRERITQRARPVFTHVVELLTKFVYEDNSKEQESANRAEAAELIDEINTLMAKDQFLARLIEKDLGVEYD